MLNTMINSYSNKYGPTFGGGLTNHLPMAQVALYKLTDDIDAVKILSDYYVQAADLEALEPSDRIIDQLESELGNAQAYVDYVDYFREKVAKLGITQTVKESMVILEDGLIGGAFHTIIKLAYALETENDDETINALAYFASEYLPLPKADMAIEINNLETSLEKVTTNDYFHTFQARPGLFTTSLLSIFNDDHFAALNFRLEGTPQAQYSALLTYAVKEYLRTGDFLELHTITALHAVDVLKAYFNDFSKVMATYTTAYIGSLLTIKERADKVITHKTRVKDWKDAIYYIRQTMDVHTIKFLYSCSELDTKYKLEDLITAINIRFSQDKMINR